MYFSCVCEKNKSERTKKLRYKATEKIFLLRCDSTSNKERKKERKIPAIKPNRGVSTK